MADDLAVILNAPVTVYTKYAMLDHVAWKWTEFEGKYTGCPYWTRPAWERRNRPRKELEKLVKHEHAVPRSFFAKLMLALPTPTPIQVYEHCEQLLFGVVVTKAEQMQLDDKVNGFRCTMPEAFSDSESAHARDPWLRFRKHGIEVLRCQWTPPPRRKLMAQEVFLPCTPPSDG